MGASTVSDAIGEQVARARHRRGWTQQHLAERIAEHGGHLDRGAVAKIESRTRGVSLDEWLLLAAALNVPPPLLLVPLGVGDAVAVTPRGHVHPCAALVWLCGESALVSPDFADGQADAEWAEWLRGAEPLTLYRELRPLQADLRQAAQAVRRAEAVGAEEQTRQARQTYADALERLYEHLRKIRHEGLSPPPVAPAILADMDAVGLDTGGMPRQAPPEDDASAAPVLAKTGEG
jgi:transcriptional regulator with XRE-family HTH domain